MGRLFVVIPLLFLAGCTCTPDGLERPVDTGEPWDTTYLIDADPSAVTVADMEDHSDKLIEHYWQYNQVRGVIWPGRRSDPALEFPDGYGTGGDSGIFTGTALMVWAFEYGVTGSNEAQMRAMETLKGLYWLTHAAGKGVIARCVFPRAEGAKWNYPGPGWEKYPEFMRKGQPLDTPWGEVLPESFYYTRATKDQLTGILAGLSVAWVKMEDVPGARNLIAIIVKSMREHLVEHNWYIRNENGKNDTNADHVTRLLRTMFNALYRRTVTISNPAEAADAEREYIDNFKVRSIERALNITNNHMQYYAHNLRILRGFSVWILEDDADRKKQCRDFMLDDIWRFTSHHQNAWFASMIAAVAPDDPKAKTVLFEGLQSISLKPLRGWSSPYGGQKDNHWPSMGAVMQGCDGNWVLPPHLRKPSNYMTWQKRPWDVGSGRDKEGRLEQTGLDFLGPYWVGRAFDAIQ